MDPPEMSNTIKKGKPRPTKISKILEPIALLTAISPRPCLATINDEKRSGMDVPTAKTVKAIIASGMLRETEIITANSTRTQLNPAIINIEKKKTR